MALALLAALLAALPVLPGVHAQAPSGTSPGPAASLSEPGSAANQASLVVLLYHPYPDAADPLGFSYRGPGAADGLDTDAFAARYMPLAPSGAFDFPFVVADGVLAAPGIPNATQPFASTLGRYTQLYQQRLSHDPPFALELTSSLAGADPGRVTATVTPRPLGSQARSDSSGFRIWAALVEDHVYYKAPAALSNNVDDHRFTVRAVSELGFLDSAGTLSAGNATLAWPVPSGAAAANLYVAAWVTAARADNTYQAGEVVQSTIHPATQTAPTVQTEKGVLLEMLSAVWCKPCQFGDLAAARMVDLHGLAAFRQEAQQATLLERPSSLAWALAAAGTGAVAVGLATRGRRGG